MIFINWLKRHEKYRKVLLKWSVLGVLVGILGGLLGVGFHYILHFVTDLRMEHKWIMLLLPLGGLATVWIYNSMNLRNNRGTNEIMDSVAKDDYYLSSKIAPAIFFSTVMTHLFGGSAGREGAALQLGGSTGAILSRLLKLNNDDRRVMTMAGMSAVFAGLFGTPMTATLFVMEFIWVGSIFSPALLPCYVSALTATLLGQFLGVYAETAVIADVALTLPVIGRIVVLAIALGLLGIVLCTTLSYCEHFSENALKNPRIRILLGSVILITMTTLVGDFRYNGAGMEMALTAIEGNANWYDFAMKLLFTSITLAAGFRGGEIVPTFCIGATFGCVLGSLLGLDPGYAAALGLVALFCSATNAPFASIMLSIEMFGGANLQAFALVCVFSFVISGNWTLYASQIIEFSKSRLTRRS